MQLTIFPRVHCAVKAEHILQNVFIGACASTRGSLKCSFIHKCTVQGETSDELFRFYPLPEKKNKVSFRGWTIDRSVNAREEERERGAKKDKEGLKESMWVE